MERIKLSSLKNFTLIAEFKIPPDSLIKIFSYLCAWIIITTQLLALTIYVALDIYGVITAMIKFSIFEINLPSSPLHLLFSPTSSPPRLLFSIPPPPPLHLISTSSSFTSFWSNVTSKTTSYSLDQTLLRVMAALGAAIVANAGKVAQVTGAVASLDGQGWSWFGLATLTEISH